MVSQTLKNRCLQVVQDLAREKGWQLPPEGIEALVEAILPFIQEFSAPSARKIQKIALNYYQDGPMVQQMLTQGSRDGELRWGEWRSYFVSQARWARSRGVRPEDVEDLAHEAFIQAHRALRTFKFESQLKTFFYSIFINRYKQWIRDTKRIQDKEQPPIEGEGDNGEILELAIPDQSPLPEDVVIEQEQNAETRELVEKEIEGIVGSVNFQIFYLSYVEETYVDKETGEKGKWTYEAIGERLGLTANAVGTRKSRVLKDLRENHPRLAEKFR